MTKIPSLPEPSPSRLSLDRALSELHRGLGSRLLTNQDSCLPYQTDDTGILGCASAVVLAKDAKDIRLCLEVCDKHSIPITSRAGGTGRTGGAVPINGGVVIATHLLDQVVDFDTKSGTIVVGPGIILNDLWRAVEAEGWFYPPDPNSSDSCRLGGTLAENAAGPRAFKYGPTRDYVLGMDTYLPGGTHFYSGRRTRKGVTGYDTTSLLVGSEGTLAVFGDITLRLIPRPQQVMTLLALFANVTAAAAAVDAIFEARLLPRCIEFLDELTLKLMRDAGNAIDVGANCLLLIEVDGDEDACLKQAERIGELCDDSGARSVVVAQTENQRAQLWSARRQMSHAVRKFAKNKISEDVVVPRHQLITLIDHVRELGESHQITALCYGHAGDGNLHVNFLWDDDEQKSRVDVATARLFEKTILLGGTLSGEHGIGITKTPYLSLEQSSAQIELQRRLKSAFDPHGIMNPGKIFPRMGHGAC